MDKNAQDHAVEVRVVTGTRRVVIRLLEITGLDTVLALFRTRAEALTPPSEDLVSPGRNPACRSETSVVEPASRGARPRDGPTPYAWAAHRS